MMRSSLCLALVTTLFLMLSPAQAVAQGAPAPPTDQAVDANGVDLIKGTISDQAVDVSIGAPGKHGLAYKRYLSRNAWRWTVDAGISGSTANPIVTLGEASDSFTLSNGVYAPDRVDGATLVVEGGSGDYVYTNRTGVVARFAASDINGVNAMNGGDIAWLRSTVDPDGTTTTFTYASTVQCFNATLCTTFVRLQSVTNNSGYMLKISYAANTASSYLDYPSWTTRTKVTAINTHVEGCNPAADSCALTHNWPAATYNASPPTLGSVTDPVGRTWSYSYNSSNLYISGMRRPGSSSDDVAIGYDTLGRVQQVTRDGVTWHYAYSISTDGTQQITTVTSTPANGQRVLVASLALGLPVSSTDELNNTTTYAYDTHGRVTNVTAPEGNGVSYTYDDRGNVVTTTITTKIGGGTRVTHAGFDATCTNPKTCNAPNWTEDAKGARTDYAYDPTTGLKTRATAPAPAGGAPRPQTRYVYATVGGVTKLASTSACQVNQSCSSTADEIKTAIQYTDNYLPSAVSKGAGDGSLTAPVTTTYDDVGNVTSVDGPLPGAADTTYYRYDASRAPVGTISPDPDGSGPLKRRAVRTTYGPDAHVTKVEFGTVDGVDDPSWSAFAALQSATISYDGYGRQIGTLVSAGGVNYSYSQVGYDSLGRVSCQALRMNPAAFGDQPDACVLGTQGADGPDRISRTNYDQAGRVLSTISGYQTPNAVTESASYTPNGNVSTLVDGKGNVTAYAYDPFDKLWRTCFQTASTAACAASPSDYDQITTRDANGSILSRRLRNGNTVTYSYDELGRLVQRSEPHNAYWETDASYAYDNLDRLTTATDSNGHILGFGYDALDRKVSQSDNWYAAGNTSFGYDSAGRRTRTTWNDGFYVTYDYNQTSEMMAIREGGSQDLAVFKYDNLGRRISLTRGNGTVTSYTYGPTSRLTELVQDLAGTGQDVSIGLGYNAASQITSRSGSNNAYVWTGGVNVNRAYVANGLNQYTQSGSIALGYDGNGNLTNSGALTYSYTNANQLATGPSGSLAYDALGRLFNTTPDIGGVNTTLNWDGDTIMTEVDQNGGGVLRRYVYGPGTDEPLLWYEGSGTGDKRYLHADERGSIVAVSDGSGTALNIKAYDEFGIPSDSNAAYAGRFGYTGQAWLPAFGLSYYKARVYSPTLGRFMQTDPIGYAGGINWYNYAGGDPVNSTDPSGLLEVQPGHGIGEGGGATYTGSMIPGVVPNGLQINGVDAQAALMSAANSSFNGFSWDAKGDNPASAQEAYDWLAKHGGYTQINGDGSRTWVNVSFGVGSTGGLGQTVSDLFNSLFGQEITEYGKRLDASDLGVTSGGTVTVRGWIRMDRAESTLHIDIEWIKATSRNSGVVMQGMGTALATAQRLGLRHIEIQGTMSEALTAFFASQTANGSWRGHRTSFSSYADREILRIDVEKSW